MCDLIKREDAVEAVYEALRTPLLNYKNDFFHDSMSYAIAIVNSIPSTEPEQKKGKWTKPEWWCNLCASYDKQRCYCNLYGIWVPSDFGCKSFGAYCDEDE